MEGIFIVLASYALVGFIWFMRGLNGYENTWESDGIAKDPKWKKIASKLRGLNYLKASPDFQDKLQDKIEKKGLADLSYKEALALTQEEFEEASRIK